ncbi:DUF3102 domain-containing protein [Chamaesiphon polymorphus]|uniref:Uncharacterized protein n=1 Tax=Chamaesiphon polymorphus CCALA 037 TaxID=2107692 RepID=A0A2T1GKU6_9CYAN|nr:DUF3102 domain-containing protein [Chamaesiphon polymorphus]PSB58465.1 hypothetical protein C7B77_04610 [Chamaesiphon polymorphus CCALA 037]
MRHINQDTKNNAQFEYETLSCEQRASVQRLTREIKEDICKTAHVIWSIGKKLVEVRSQLETCQFSSWLRIEFDWCRSTAYNFISVYEAFPEFSCPTVGQLDISVSALYLLAAPSTSPETRSHFIGQALAGKYVSKKAVQMSRKGEKKGTDENNKLVMRVPPISDRAEQPISIDPEIEYLNSSLSDRSKYKVKNSDSLARKPEFQSVMEKQPPSIEEIITPNSNLRPTWNSLSPRFSLFWGDTHSPRFLEYLPEDAFVFAIPSCQSHHDWLLNDSRNCITLSKENLQKELVEGLLSAVSLGGKALIFPWIPGWKIIELALKLNLRIYVGDRDLKQCEKIVLKLSLGREF